MVAEDGEIPYGHVRLKCKACNAVYFVSTKELKRKAEETHGFFPCKQCGSNSTAWDFRPIK